jgi:hypothetical protein
MSDLIPGESTVVVVVSVDTASEDSDNAMSSGGVVSVSSDAILGGALPCKMLALRCC